jgi:hypothetical protein
MNKKLFSLRSIVSLALIALAGCGPSRNSTAENRDCLDGMAEETTAYIKEKKIPLKGSNGELYSNENEQVYLLSSQESVKLDSNEPVKSPVAVINRKEAGGKRSYYLIEQEITADKVTFILSKDSQVLESLPVPLVRPAKTIPGPGGPGQGSCEGVCDSAKAENDAKIQAALAEANRTCLKQGLCLPVCQCVNGVPYYQQSLIDVNPTSWRCRREIAIKNQPLHFFALRNTGPFLDEAFDIAMRKAAKLYTN